MTVELKRQVLGEWRKLPRFQQDLIIGRESFILRMQEKHGLSDIGGEASDRVLRRWLTADLLSRQADTLPAWSAP
jgi:hypothetical protein